MIGVEGLSLAIVVASAVGEEFKGQRDCGVVQVGDVEAVVSFVGRVEDREPDSCFLSAVQFLLESHGYFPRGNGAVFDHFAIEVAGGDVVVEVLRLLVDALVSVVTAETEPDVVVVVGVVETVKGGYHLELESEGSLHPGVPDAGAGGFELIHVQVL